jgi:two-component sensor histidine kinase
MEELIRAHSQMSNADIDWLSWLVDEWGLLADLSFSDLILWVPDEDDNIFWAVAQVRPSTGPTSIKDSVVGEDISYDPESLVTEAYLSRQPTLTEDNKLHMGIPVSSQALPLLDGERCIGVVEAHMNRLGFRAPGALEENYLRIAKIMGEMLMRREFPIDGVQGKTSFSPRLGDGMIRTDTQGVIAYASPNARSVFRHLRVATEMEGEDFGGLLRKVLAQTHQPLNFSVGGVLQAKTTSEVDLISGEVSARLRIYPLRSVSGPAGMLVLTRDTTDLRRQEQQLTTKDATIREIHHRVKNSLQMVAALLRLQARRIDSPEARGALDTATKRVAAIAAVHNILSHTYSEIVDYDEVAARLFRMIGESVGDSEVSIVQRGSFGELSADIAERLSLVLTEICQNAAEHGFHFKSGEIVVTPSRNEDRLKIEVFNDGEPLPSDFELSGSTSLGLSIAKTMVADMGGEFTLAAVPGGTLATVRVPMA